MSSFFIGLLIFFEMVGLAGSQKIVENSAKKIGFSDPFEIYKVSGEAESRDGSEVFGKTKNVAGDKVRGLTFFPEVSLDQIKPFPAQNSSIKPSITADAAYVYDLESGKVLFSKNPEKIRSIASVTKVMTAIVVIESKDINEVISVPAAAAWVTGSKMHLYPGERIKVKELVAGMLIASGNDAAKALEMHYGKENLTSLMNEKAEWLGLENTHYTECSGLDPNDHSSVRDLAILSGYALRNQLFKKIVDTRTYTAFSADGKISHLIHTTNRLLKNYPDVFGLKTGYTEEAGNCLIAGSKKNNHYLVAIVLGVPDGDARFSEARYLLDWAIESFEW